MRNILLFLMILLGQTTVNAQKFFNLTADQVRLGDKLPCFEYSQPLGTLYADSVYAVSIEYPEFIDMQKSDVEKLKKMNVGKLPEMPEVKTDIAVEKKKGILEVYFNPIVLRNGKYQKLVSFMLKFDAKAKGKKVRRLNAVAKEAKADRYVKNSVLAKGTWAKIRVPSSGVYNLSDALIKRAGFSNPEKVKIYGYGGALHDEELKESSIMAYDDLKEVPTCIIGGKRLFHAVGPVTWSSRDELRRTRNPYSDYGYYFLTQSDDEPARVDSATFLNSFYPSNDDYHALHEVDNYAWYQGGRNLYESTPINVGSSATYTLTVPAGVTAASMYVAVTAAGGSKTTTIAEISINDSIVGQINIPGCGDYDKAQLNYDTFRNLSNLKTSNVVKISNTGGSAIRLDYISLAFKNGCRPAPNFTAGTFNEPEYVYNITNQNHHADKPCDMVIIVPTSQKTVAQAERLKAYHEKHDKMSVRIVPADELYNEFSSGTPEADAYRLYMKMLYDRAETEAEMPKYLILFGDCVWDNRMKTTETASLNVDDYLLCFESENSLHAVRSFVDDGFFCALDDGEGKNASANSLKMDKYDVAVGRFPVTTVEQTKIMVDKTIDYMDNKYAGSWQNVAMFLGDDGNNNAHMEAADSAATTVERLVPGLQVKRVLWDMYNRVTSSTGNTYPEVTAIIKKQQNEGALLFNYCGHGRADQMSHESVLRTPDFAEFKNKGLSLWVTASCDIMPFDGTIANIGETAILNPDGCAVAFFGTTRTVYTDRNRKIDQAYLKALFTKENGKYISIGEAQRVAKNFLVTTDVDGDVTENKLQYSLLGDPALVLNVPSDTIVIDSINGVAVDGTAELPSLKAGAKANIKGHVAAVGGGVNTAFNGIITIDVKDAKEKVVGRMNDTSSEGTNESYIYYDYVNTLFSGNDSIRSGKFDVSFAVTKDINYSGENGRVTLFGINDKGTVTANGSSDDFYVKGADDLATDSVGPSVYCYLNSRSFTNGDNVNPTPYFVAELSDQDGLNASGSGIGHDMQLVIDDDPLKTYSLNDNFSYEFGSFTKGSTYYNIPELEEGAHYLKFTAWDVLNNPTTSMLKFNVVRGITPKLASVGLTNNPAKTNTTFIINHDRSGSNMDVCIEVYDGSGRLLWKHKESGVSSGQAYTYNWDLCTDGGSKLQSGVYLYRVSLSCDGSREVTKAKKLIVLD